MKNFIKLLGAMRSIAIIATVAVIGFSMTACGGDEDSGGGGTATIIFKNESEVTVNFVQISTWLDDILDVKDANIAPGAEKSYKIKPLKNNDYIFYMGETSSSSTYGTSNPRELASGKTYTATWSGGLAQNSVIVTEK